MHRIPLLQPSLTEHVSMSPANRTPSIRTRASITLQSMQIESASRMFSLME